MEYLVPFAIQVISAYVLIFGDIGFDHPGRSGLDFEDALVLFGIYTVSLVVGLSLAVKSKQFKFGALQLGIPLAYLVYVYLPPPHYNSLEYQFLVGKNREEVERIIGNPKGRTTGWEGRNGVKIHNITLHGMTIYLSDNGVVTEVASNSR